MYNASNCIVSGNKIINNVSGLELSWSGDNLITNNQIFNRRLEVKDSQIQFMDTELNRSTIHPAWWIVGGIVIGAGIALGSFAAAGQFSQ